MGRGAEHRDIQAGDAPGLRGLVVHGAGPSQTHLVRAFNGRGFAAVDTATTLASARATLAHEPGVDCIVASTALPDAAGGAALRALALAAPGAALLAVCESRADPMLLAALAHSAHATTAASATAEELYDKLTDALHQHVAARTVGESTSLDWLEKIPAPAVVVDPSGRTTGANGAWHEVRGLSSTEHRYLEVIRSAVAPPPRAVRDLEKCLAKVHGGSEATYLIDLPGNEGRPSFIARLSPLPGGKALVAHLDVTDVRTVVAAHAEARSSVTGDLVPRDADVVGTVGADGSVKFVPQRLQDDWKLDVLGRSGFEIVHPHDLAAASEALARVVERPSETAQATVRVIDGNHRWHVLDVTLRNLLDDPTIAAIVIAGYDRTAQRETAIADALSAVLPEILPAAVVVTDDAGLVVFWSRMAEELFGYPRDQAVGREIRDLIENHEDPSWEAHVERFSRLRRLDIDYVARRRNGTTVPVACSLRSLDLPDVGFRGVIFTALDASVPQRLRTEITRLSTTDPATGLGNAEAVRAFLEALGQEGRLASVLHVDIDRLKLVNDAFGSATGDEVISLIAKRLRAAVGHDDEVGRLGGDEFAVVSTSATTPNQAVALAERLRRAIGAAPAHGSPTLAEAMLSHGAVSVSIGVAVGGRRSSTSLLRDAEDAVERAKKGGRSRIVCWDEHARVEARDLVALEGELRQALERNELEMHYQPHVELETGRICGAEALVRWSHPTRGLLAPGQFLDLAERSGLVVPLGEQVLQMSCAAAVRWNRKRRGDPIPVYVNVSAVQLGSEDLVHAVGRALRESGLDPSLLFLELTETALLRDPDATVVLLRAIHDSGVRIAIDDFGAGYSSLSYLRRFPIDVLKIDNSYIEGVPGYPEDNALVTAIVRLGRSLGLRVIAEGVEYEAQTRFLHEQGCGVGQGRLFSPPVDEDRLDLDTIFLMERSAGSGTGGMDDAHLLEQIAAELKAPLTVIAGYTQTLESVVDETNADAMAASVEAIERHVHLAEDLVDVMTDAHAANHGSLTLHPAPSDLAALARGALLAAGPHLRGRDVRTALPSSAPTDLDARRVQRAISALVANAALYSPPGTPIEVELEGEGGAYRVHVRDEAGGLPSEAVDAVFDRPSRLDRAGPGLGLYLARQVALGHGGDLTYAPRPGGGAVFTLELPAMASAAVRNTD